MSGAVNSEVYDMKHCFVLRNNHIPFALSCLLVYTLMFPRVGLNTH